jgi:hypothetical protein
MDNGESKACGHGGVNSVAAGAEDFNAGISGEMVDADDHPMLGADRLLVKIGDHVLRALLSGSGKRKKRKYDGCEDGRDGEWVPLGHGVLTE